MLSERFPALMDYYATTAKPTDSFIGGVAGAGYVYLGLFFRTRGNLLRTHPCILIAAVLLVPIGALTDEQLQRYTRRVGRLYKEYGPEVADTYGQGNLTTIAKCPLHWNSRCLLPLTLQP